MSYLGGNIHLELLKCRLSYISSRVMKVVLYALCLLCVSFAGGVQAQIYADVKTTKGDFTIFLAYATAPKTVANFIRLAEGSASWVDPVTGQVKKGPYYNGTTFPQVIAGSVSVAGSKTGSLNDAPGYYFQDEFNAGNHNAPYVVSMSNSGPNTNGAPFFITASSQPQFNAVNSVFGQVILYDAPGDGTTYVGVGREVCNAINSVSIDTNGKPLVDVAILKVTIRRVGVLANAFNEHAQRLPEVVAPLTQVIHQGAQVSLALKQPSASLTSYRYSTDLLSWLSALPIYKDATDDLTLGIDVTSHASGQDKMFFNASQLLYDTFEPLWPRDLTGRTLSLVIPELASQWSTTSTFTFTSENGGTSARYQESGNFTVISSRDDWLGSWKYIKTGLKYVSSGKNRDVHLYLRVSRDTTSPALFQGRHRGAVYLMKGDTVKEESTTSGAMTLTR